jgi:hypothetical protein
MKVEVNKYDVTVTREEGDKRVKNESQLLHLVKVEMLKQGFNVIKKRMWKDGHLVDDEQQYIRTRGWRFCVYNAHYAITDAAKAYNKEGVYYFQRVEL